MIRKYSAIVKSDNIQDLVDQIDKLEKQTVPPDAYFFAIQNELAENEWKIFLDKINLSKKLWKLKIAVNNLTINELIDEYFITGSIPTHCCLYVDGPIKDDLSDTVKLIVDECEECWFFKFDKHQFFYKVLCVNYPFQHLEKGLISDGYSDRIYGDLVEEHSTT